MTPTNSMAQDAMKTHDQSGEKEMLAFIRRRLDTRPAGQENNPTALTVLKDHSAVMATSDRYFFLWTPGEEELKHPLGNTRGRNIQDQPMPTHGEERPMEIAGAVTRHQILHEALKHVETNVRLGMGQSEVGQWLANDPPISEETARAAAPELMRQVELQTSGVIEQDALYDLMDSLSREVALEILDAVPAQERTALDTAMTKAVEAG